jgi:hypothetical protein
VEDDLAGTFGLADSTVGNIDLGLRTSISGADINGDGALELVIGNYRGGIEIFTLEGSAVIGISGSGTNGSKIKIYPNPSSGFFMLENNTQNASIGAYRVKDLLGRSVAAKWKLNAQAIQLDLTCCQAGIYFVEVFLSNGKRHTEKLILR